MLRDTLLSSFAELEIDPSAIGDDTSLEYDLGMDSQEFIELHVILEKKLNLRIPNGTLSKIKDFKGLLQYLHNNSCTMERLHEKAS